MECGHLRDELNCSICLSLYTDPVSLRCGHNFCRSCIVQVLDKQDGSGGYSCPDCRVEYPERPTLEKNRKLGNIVEHYLSTPDMEKTRIFCTYCIKSPVPAVKSCLQCETSLCDDHLTAHNKAVDHVIIEPTDSVGNKRCPIHNKVLELYCPQDAACLCMSCLVGEHRGHQVELLDEAFEKKKKKLRKNLDKIKSQKAKIQPSVQNLQNHRRNILKKVSNKRKNIRKIFMDINNKVKMAEKKALSEISRQEEKIVSQISHLIKELEIKEDELSRKMRHLEEMCRVTDPIRLLQESDITGCGHRDGKDTREDGGKIKSQENLDSLPVSGQDNFQVSETKEQRCPRTVQDHGAASSDKSVTSEDESTVCNLQKISGLDEVLISLTLHRSMRDIVTNVTSQLGIHVPDILLDEDTAYENVKLSEDLKTATHSEEEQNKPESPGRFLTYSQVLSRCGLSSGRHYWEVEWNQIVRCDIGVSYPSIEKEGDDSGIGDNDKSWCLTLETLECSVVHDSTSEPVLSQPTCPKIGVFLDYEAGRLSFYELCDPIRHLHTISASFTEPLHVIFYVHEGASVTIRS